MKVAQKSPSKLTLSLIINVRILFRVISAGSQIHKLTSSSQGSLVRQQKRNNNNNNKNSQQTKKLRKTKENREYT